MSRAEQRAVLRRFMPEYRDGFIEMNRDDTVVAIAVEANTGSRRVMEKVGMVCGGDFDHPSIPELSPLRRQVLYSLKPDNWQEKSSPIRILV